MTHFHHIALNCKDPAAIERYYVKHFGFRRARFVKVNDQVQIVFLKAGAVHLELFKTADAHPAGPAKGDGYGFQGTRHIAFMVDDVDAKLREMGGDANVTVGPMAFDAFIPGWKSAWLADPEGNIVEISQGYVDEPNPPPLA